MMRPSLSPLLRRVGLALFLPLLMGLPAWAADEMLVIRSTAPALPAGTVLAADASLALPAGSWAILIDDTGRKLRLAGRFEGRPADRFTGPPGGSSGAVAALRPLTQTADAGSFAGGLRGGPGAGPRRTDPWAISVHDSGAACARGSAVLFWRADPSREAKMTVRLGAGGQRTVVPFAKGQTQIALPASLFAPGQALKVELDGEPDPAQVTLHALPRSAVSPVDQAVWMATVGCRSQAQTMLDQLS